MNKKFNIFSFLAVLAVAGLMFSGCYTQLDSSKNETRDEDQGYSSSQQDESNNYRDRDMYDDDYGRTHVGFSYYYPSYGFPSYSFNAAYNDPYYGYGNYGGYYGGYYNSYNPYYGSGYGYYNPYNYYSYYYPSYYNRYGYTYGTPVMHRVRDFGSTRGGAPERGTINGGAGYSPQPTGGYSGTGGALPTGSGYNRSGAGAAQGVRSTPQQTAPAPRRDGSLRTMPRGTVNQKDTRSTRGMGSRGRNTGTTGRDTQVRNVPNESSAPVYNTPPKERNTREASAPPRNNPAPGAPPADTRTSGSSRGRRP